MQQSHVFFRKERNQHIVEVHSTRLHVFWQILGSLFRFFKLLIKQAQHEVCQSNQELQDVLLARTEEHHVALVKGELAHGGTIVFKEFHVLLVRVGVLCKSSLTHCLDLLPSSFLVPPAYGWDSICLELLIVVRVVRVILELLLLLHPRRFDLMEQSYVFIEQRKPHERKEFGHYHFFHVSLDSE